jgi:hypothetical protein
MQLKIISDTRKHIGKKLLYIDLIKEIILKNSKMRAGVSNAMKGDIGLLTVRKIREKKREEIKKGKPFTLIK